MLKPFFSLVLFIVIHEALNLTCYTSNFESLMTGNIENLTKHQLQDCNDYIEEVSKLSVTPTNVTETLHCFTIAADYMDVEFKGCIPEEMCNNMVKVFKQMIQTKGGVSEDAMGNVDCEECEEDGCNYVEVLKKFWTKETEETTTERHSSVSDGNCFRIKCPRCLVFIIFYYSLCYVMKNR